MYTVIIGGSRGIGHALAEVYAERGDTVVVTGRRQPEKSHPRITFCELNLSNNRYVESIDKFVSGLAHVDRLVFAPGYYQEGTITDLKESEVLDMIQVCGTSFIFMARSLLLTQGGLAECIVITSSSQWTPRKLEPVYNFAKAGVGHFARALALDGRVQKVLVAGPTGTKTAFHAKRKNVDMTTYHEPHWVAEQIYNYSCGDFNYKFIKILRDPASVEVAELVV